MSMYDGSSRGSVERLTRGLREQLQTMTAAAHALGSNLAGNGKAEEYLAVLEHAICSQLRLVRQAELNERLYGNNELRVILAPMDLAALGRDVMKKTDALTRPLLDIKAEFSSSLAALPTQADQAALEEMLLCFIANSVRVIGRGGTIRLELERVEGRAVFTLTDTGCGLAPEVLAGLFVPDEDEKDREDGEDREESENQEESEDREDGEALEFPVRGLRLARRIAVLHSATLMAGNTEAGGACLAVSLPIVERASGALCSPAIPVDCSGGWDPVLVALSGCLPREAFLPERQKR